MIIAVLHGGADSDTGQQGPVVMRKNQIENTLLIITDIEIAAVIRIGETRSVPIVVDTKLQSGEKTVIRIKPQAWKRPETNTGLTPFRSRRRNNNEG